jgi:hypothetical protein
MLGHEHLTTTCKYYLGIIAEADVKAAHAQYLSYDINQGEKTSVLALIRQTDHLLLGSFLAEYGLRVLSSLGRSTC